MGILPRMSSFVARGIILKVPSGFVFNMNLLTRGTSAILPFLLTISTNSSATTGVFAPFGVSPNSIANRFSSYMTSVSLMPEGQRTVQE